MIDGAVFDLDGTLLDSMTVWNTMGSRYLKSLGIEPKEGIDEKFRSMTLHDAAAVYKNEYGCPLGLNEIMDGVNSLAEEFYFYEAEAKKGVREFLLWLFERDVKMCVATATDEYLARAALKRNGISDFFPEIITCTDMRCGKDVPDMFDKALLLLSTKKHKTAVFEDSFVALNTVKRAGFPAVGVYDRYEKKRTLIMNTADFYIESFEKRDKLCAFLDSL